MSRSLMHHLGALAGSLFGAALGLLALSSLLPSAPASFPSPTPVAQTEQPQDAGAQASSPVSNSRRSSKSPRLPAKPRTPLPVLTQTDAWPSEPTAPSVVADITFGSALAMLCGPYADGAVGSWYAPWVLRAARDFAVDPFLLGGLMFAMSGCVGAHGSDSTNLTRLDSSLYSADMRNKRYRYYVFAEGRWAERVLPVERFPFDDAFVRSDEANIYFAAAFLRGWSEQANGLRATIVQPSDYRHYVSHFVWGDQVSSHREEDAILVARRRLLQYYGALPATAEVTWRGFTLGCPLDGCPRVVTSTLGDARDEGRRRHAGNDFESSRGEPVRAVADGRVVFAGVDLPGRGAASRIPIWAQRDVQPEVMGAGGLYVCIDHGNSDQGEQLVSCYMHLEAATVVQGRELRRGDQVGRVGTSGIKHSQPHLHFELHARDGVHRATEVLRGLALGGTDP